jgi:hypothetical protein
MQDVRRKGHDTERAFVRWLKANGFPDATTSRAVLGRDGFAQFSDIIGVDGYNIEVKNRVKLNIGESLAQATDGASTPICVVKPYGTVDPGYWWGITYVRYMADWWKP